MRKKIMSHKECMCKLDVNAKNGNIKIWEVFKIIVGRHPLGGIKLVMAKKMT